MAVCAIENRRESVNIAGIGHEYAEKVENAIDSFIGNKDQYSKSDLVVYNKIYKLLNNFFNKNSLMINSVSDPQIFIDGLLKEYQLKSTGNIGVLNSDTIKYSKNALSGIFNRTKHIISRMEKQSKKGNVNDFATMLREPFMVGVLNDPSGLMNVLSKKIQAFTDRRGQRFLAKKTRIDDSREPLNSLLQDRLSGEFTDNIANEYIANGLEGFTVYDGIKGSKTEGRRTTVEVMKVENITEGDGENAKVTVKDSDGNTETLGVIFNTKEGIFNKLKGQKGGNKVKKGVVIKDNLSDHLKKSIKDKYTNQLMAEVLDGRVRYIEAGDVPSPRDLEIIKRQLKEETIRQLTKDPNRKSQQVGYFHHVVSEGWRINYVMVKQSEGQPGKEVYKAYIISRELLTDEATKKNRVYYYRRVRDGNRIKDFHYVPVTPPSGSKFLSLKDLNLLKDGFYRSDKTDSYGTRLNKYYNYIPFSVNRQWQDFKKVSNDRYDEIADLPEFWKTITTFRREMKSIPNTVNTVNEENLTRNVRSAEYLKTIRKNDQTGVIDRIFKQMELEELYKFTFYEIRENYFPNLFPTAVNQQAINEEVAKLEKQMILEPDPVKKETLQAVIDGLQGNNKNDTYEDKRILQSKIAFTKHRTNSMNGLKMRKDGEVISDYFISTSDTLEKNKVLSESLETIVNLIKNNGGKVEGIEHKLEYIDKFTQQTFGSPDIDLPNPFVSFQNFADGVNKIVKPFDPTYNMTAENASNLVKYVKSIVSSAVLGSKGAKPNRFQSISAIIPYGFKLWFDAVGMLDGSAVVQKKVRDWLGHYGTGNVSIQLNDQIFLGGDSSVFDAGFLEMGALKIPTMNMLDWVRMYRAGRSKFVSQDTFLDKHFKNLAKRRLKVLGKTLDRMEEKAKNEKIKTEIKYLKDIYWQIFFADKKTNTDKNLTRLFTELLPGITAEKMRSIVHFKLTYHLTKSHRDTITFTGTESKVRDEIALISVLAADSIGGLGEDMPEIIRTKDPVTGKITEKEGDIIEGSRFMTNTAANIARNAVYQYAFGISKVYLPMMFEGTGALALQFKNFPLNQMILDGRNIKNFKDTTPVDAKNKVLSMVTRFIKAGGNFSQLWNPNFKDDSIDHDALQFFRGTMIRGLVSVLSIWNELLRFPVVRGLMRNFQAPVGGLENPMLSMFGRLFARSLLLSVYVGIFDDDDESDTHLNKMADNLMFLFIPAFLSVTAWSVMEGGKLVKDLLPSDYE